MRKTRHGRKLVLPVQNSVGETGAELPETSAMKRARRMAKELFWPRPPVPGYTPIMAFSRNHPTESGPRAGRRTRARGAYAGSRRRAVALAGGFACAGRPRAGTA